MNAEIQQFVNALPTEDHHEYRGHFTQHVHSSRDTSIEPTTWNDIGRLLRRRDVDESFTFYASKERALELLNPLYKAIPDDFIYLKLHLWYCAYVLNPDGRGKVDIARAFIEFGAMNITELLRRSTTTIDETRHWPVRFVDCALRYNINIKPQLEGWLAQYETQPMQMIYIEGQRQHATFTFLEVCQAVLKYSDRHHDDELRQRLWSLIQPIETLNTSVGPQRSGLRQWFEFALTITPRSDTRWSNLQERYLEAMERFAQHIQDTQGPFRASVAHGVILQKLQAWQQLDCTDTETYRAHVRAKRALILQLRQQHLQQITPTSFEITLPAEDIEALFDLVHEATTLKDLVAHLITLSPLFSKADIMAQGESYLTQSIAAQLATVRKIATDGRSLGVCSPHDSPEDNLWHHGCKATLMGFDTTHSAVTNRLIIQLLEQGRIDGEELGDLLSSYINITHQSFFVGAITDLTEHQYDAALHKLTSIFEHALIRWYHLKTGKGIDTRGNPVSITPILIDLTSDQGQWPEHCQEVAWTWRLLLTEEFNGQNLRHNIAHGVHGEATQAEVTKMLLCILWLLRMGT